MLFFVLDFIGCAICYYAFVMFCLLCFSGVFNFYYMRCGVVLDSCLQLCLVT